MQADMIEIAAGLRFPEGPVALPDGRLLCVEIAAGALTMIEPGRKPQRIVDLGGGPNGAAIGPDGRVYICNNGGFCWNEQGGLLMPHGTPDTYPGGSIQVVDLGTLKVETLYTHCEGRRLCGPNDIVFDAQGGFWFTDHGKTRERDMDRTGVFYARIDGSYISEQIFPMHGPNGVGLSPDEKTLYVAETFTGRVWAYPLEAPGTVAPQLGLGVDRLLYTAPGGYELYDSLAVDAEGNVCVAALVSGGVRSISPGGELVDFCKTGDLMTTNICFGGADLRDAYITLSGTGRIMQTRWPRAGLALNFLNK